jgi:hypothetical protein
VSSESRIRWRGQPDGGWHRAALRIKEDGAVAGDRAALASGDLAASDQSTLAHQRRRSGSKKGGNF